MVTAFTSGKLDIAFQVRDLGRGRRSPSDKNASILEPTTISERQAWEVDTTSPPFNNVAARQALSYAIDRATMVKVAFAGQATPTLTNDLVNPANPAFNKSSDARTRSTSTRRSSSSHRRAFSPGRRSRSSRTARPSGRRWERSCSRI